MRKHIIALGAVAALVGTGACTKDAPPAAPAAPAPAAPAAPAPSPATAPPPPPSALQVAQDALKTAATPQAIEAALGGLKRHLEGTPPPADAAEAARALASEALGRAATAFAGDPDAARRLARLVAGDDGSLVAPVRAALAGEADPAQLIAQLVLVPGLDGVEAGARVAASPGAWQAAAKALVAAKVAPIAKAFAPASLPEVRLQQIAAAVPAGDWAVCPEARSGEASAVAGCAPGYYGVQDAAWLPALAGPGLAVMRLATLARGAGEAAPKGVLELPIPSAGAPEPKAPIVIAAKALPLETVVVDAAGVHLTLRPTVSLEDPGPIPARWPGAAVMAPEVLEAATTEEALKPLVDAIVAHRAIAAAAEARVLDPAGPVNAKREKGAWAVTLWVDGAVTAPRLLPVLKALDLAGYGDVRWVRGGGPLAVVPAPLRAERIPAARWGRTESRPLIVHLKADSADVFEPKGEGQAPREATEVTLPVEAKRWYKGQTVFKTEVRGTDEGPLVQAVRAVRRDAAGGTVVVVVPAPDVSAGRLVAVTAAIAAAEGPERQKAISEVFPDLACQDEAPGAPAGCVSLFPVVGAETAVPSATGLTDKPEGKKEAKPEEKPVEKPAEEPKLGFCDQGDIKRVITSRTGAFKFCYERKLQLDQTLQGTVKVRVVIGEDGSVSNVSTSGSMPDKGVHECVAKTIRGLQFRRPDGGQCVVNYPFVFQP